MDKRQGDDLVQDLLAGDSGGDKAHLLLQELFAGYPIESVSRLIRSGVPEAVKAGAWLMSEVDAQPLIADVPFLLDHPERNARFFGIDVVVDLSRISDGATIAKAVMLVNDHDVAVRGKAIRMLAVMRAEDLARAIESIPSPPVRELTRWLLDVANEIGRADDVIARLDSNDPATRRFAAAAARRIAPASDAALRVASTAKDPDVSRFAEFELHLQSLR